MLWLAWSSPPRKYQTEAVRPRVTNTVAPICEPWTPADRALACWEFQAGAPEVGEQDASVQSAWAPRWTCVMAGWQQSGSGEISREESMAMPVILDDGSPDKWVPGRDKKRAVFLRVAGLGEVAKTKKRTTLCGQRAPTTRRPAGGGPPLPRPPGWVGVGGPVPTAGDPGSSDTDTRVVRYQAWWDRGLRRGRSGAEPQRPSCLSVCVVARFSRDLDHGFLDGRVRVVLREVERVHAGPGARIRRVDTCRATIRRGQRLQGGGGRIQ